MSCCGGPRTGKAFDPRDEGPSEEDLCRFGSDVRACPSCGDEMYDDASVCASCGHAVGSGMGSGRGKGWIVAAALVAAVAVAAFFLAPIL